MSNRAEVLEQLPRHGAPPQDWKAAVQHMVGLGLVSDSTALWWDVRPSPKFGTLEFRIADQPTELARSVAFVELFQALCAKLLGEADGRPAERTLYEEARWAAAQYGPRARLPHPDGDRLVSVPDLLDELLERVRLPGLLAGDGCEGDRQLELGAAGGLKAVCADLAARSLP